MKDAKSIKTEPKGCGKYVEFWGRYCGQFEDLKHSDHYIYCDKCKYEIAILEQAIAEINELKQMYELRNDDAKDYARVITELKAEIKNIQNPQNKTGSLHSEIIDGTVQTGSVDICKNCVYEDFGYCALRNSKEADNVRIEEEYNDKGCSWIKKCSHFKQQLNQPKTER